MGANFIAERPAPKIDVQGPPDAPALEQRLQEGAAALAREFPALLEVRIAAEELEPNASRKGPIQVRLALLFPRHQVHLGRAGASADATLREALAAGRAAIERLALRDPGVVS